MRLSLKRTLIVLAVVIVIVGALLIWLDRRFTPRIGPTVETWETSNQRFRIRVDNHAEEHAFLPGAYYVFRSAPAGSDSWRDIMTFRHDDPGPIRREQVRFVNDRVAFVFMGWMFAATDDAGATWSVWDAHTDSKWCCNYQLIKDVLLESDGTGIMLLNPIQNPNCENPELRTKDFGLHWSA